MVQGRNRAGQNLVRYFRAKPRTAFSAITANAHLGHNRERYLRAKPRKFIVGQKRESQSELTLQFYYV